MCARILTGLVGIPLAVVLIFYPGGLPLAAAAGVIAVFGALEFYGGARGRGTRPIEWTGLAAALLFVLWARTSGDAASGLTMRALLMLCLLLAFCVELLRRNRTPLTDLGVTVFGAVYTGWLISHVVLLRAVEGSVTTWSWTAEAGAWLLMFVFVCTWACDTCAYFIGKFYGHTKFAPKVSPNKTVEGAVAGFVGAVLAGAILGTIINLPAQHSLVMGAIIGVFSELGDFSASAIKRDMGIKDFGQLIPGHGGILDRFDSVLFSGTAAYYYFALFLQNWPS